MAACGSALAGPWEDGFTASKRGDYVTAMRLWRPLADQGYAAAQLLLSGMYYKGQGVTQDYAEAVKWFRKAADQGIAAAQLNLGLMYYNGLGVTQDYAEAVKWYRKAADQGDAGAQFNLGGMYRIGQGVTQDFVEAHKWYNLSAAHQIDAQKRDVASKSRDEVAAKMTAAQIAEAQKLAREWKPK